MLIRAALLVILGILGSSANVYAHKYFFSITEMDWQQDTQQFEVIIDLSTHDLEYALSALNNKSIHVEHPEFETLTKQWLSQNLVLKQADKVVPFHWIGQQSTHKQVALFLKTGSIDPGQSLILTNSLLINFFSKQVNTVNIAVMGQKKTLTFDVSNQQHTLTLVN
jgi:hypothetical protein